MTQWLTTPTAVSLYEEMHSVWHCFTLFWTALHSFNYRRVTNCVKDNVSDLHFWDLRSIFVFKSKEKIIFILAVSEFLI